ncbi:hypothetical protein B0H15DRAFT_837229 [Mycena belliarum]|uniref:F-box domain-containing protein n=1 Tax=Mycena belliarum TaxID=1033014 RepID=A0AAD6XQ30_9AGAR|nr:hypothetical protein B0H15DRAFT_837229 [Mycena belliae]
MGRSRKLRVSTTATLLDLPPEICATICEDMEQRRDLRALCRISHLFRDQARRLLYRKVDLRERDLKALRSWCLAVTRNPQVAELVRVLSISLSCDLSLSSDAAKVARALSSCLNLKELSIYTDKGSNAITSYTKQSIQGWLLNTCPFRLTKFSNAYFRSTFIAPFWDAQTDLRVLALPSFRDSESFPCYADQLPNLVALEVHSVAALPKDRALQRIQFHLYRSSALEELAVLGRYSPTLTTLNVVQSLYVETQPTTQAVLEHIVQAVPGLLHLGLTEADSDLKPTVFFTEATPVHTLAKFSTLQTFVLGSRSIVAFDDTALGCAYDLQSRDGLSAFGRTIMDACPALRQAIVGARIYARPGPRSAWALDPRRLDTRSGWDPKIESVCTLTRTAAGEVESEDGDRFDFQSASMFWEL